MKPVVVNVILVFLIPIIMILIGSSLKERWAVLTILLFTFLTVFLLRNADAFFVVAWVVVTAGVYVLCGKHLAEERRQRRGIVVLSWILAGFGVIALLFTFGPIILHEYADEKAAEYYQEGVDSLEQEEYQDAVTYFSKAVKGNQDPLYLCDYAIALARNGEDEKAEEILKQISEGNSTDDALLKKKLLRIRAEIYFARGEYEKVPAIVEEVELIRSWSSNDERFEIKLLCAKAYEKMGNEWLDEEIELLEEENNGNGSLFPKFKEQLDSAYTRAGWNVSDIAESMKPSMVFVDTTGSEAKAGIGIIVASSAAEVFIVTSADVVEPLMSGEAYLDVTFYNTEADEKGIISYSNAYDTRVARWLMKDISLSVNRENDIAVIGVPMNDIPEETKAQINISKIGTSDDLQESEPVIAITRGNDTIWPEITTMMIKEMDDTRIQTDDASVHRVNSGVLLNMQGELVGIISSESESRKIIGVPVDYALSFIERSISISKQK
ncbi:MAG: tetratricopeptide repeat protein [Clostridiales bacterium]|nr:tetratricopeptide repeat protein [Clostridiales bacterium]